MYPTQGFKTLGELSTFFLQPVKAIARGYISLCEDKSSS